jgi:cytochrome P450
VSTAAAVAYKPPRPHSLAAIPALFRTVWRGEGDLLSLLPAKAYRIPIGYLGYSRRSILIVNAPELVRAVLTDPGEVYPKADIMVSALEPLVGESIFVASGARWRRQRRMIDPAFSHMRLNRAFVAMTAAVDACEQRLDADAANGRPLSLDLTMSSLTADVICRTVFSASLESQTARDVFDAFTVFERSVAQVQVRRLIMDPAFTTPPQQPEVLAACQRIRGHLGDLLDTHLGPDGTRFDDIAAAVVAARDLETGTAFTREELLDELGVMFLAGHETTASGLTWAFFILAMQPAVLARLRAEVATVCGDGPVEFEHVRRLAFTRNVFREALRLYPPITFLPRVLMEAATLGPYRVKRGALIMVSPWTIHRHRAHWRDPDVFDPDRFSPEREAEIVPGTYLPFGLGPRVCVGAGFAQTEATLILARLARRYDFRIDDVARVRPVARLTTRPAEEIGCRVTRHPAGMPA